MDSTGVCLRPSPIRIVLVSISLIDLWIANVQTYLYGNSALIFEFSLLKYLCACGLVAQCHLCALAVPAAAHVVFCGQSRQTRLTHWTSHWHLKQLMAVEGKSVPAAEE